jgi:hypothetical protein
VPLLVKPNPRRARAFMDSPSVGRFVNQRGATAFPSAFGQFVTPVFGRIFVAAAIVGVVLLGLKLLAVI